jgi:hypothetical protein
VNDPNQLGDVTLDLSVDIDTNSYYSMSSPPVAVDTPSADDVLNLIWKKAQKEMQGLGYL